MLPAAQLPLPVTPHAPQPAPLPSIEPMLGEVVVAAVLATMDALREREAGELTAETKTRGGDAIACLYQLRYLCLMAGALPYGFDESARSPGVRLLQNYFFNMLTTNEIYTLVDGILEILGKVVRSQAH